MAAPRFHVAAACNGLVCLFELRGKELQLYTDPESGHNSFTPAAFAQHLRVHQLGQQQLVLVGSPTDIAWLHASIPTDTSWGIAAEIPYPLLPDWLSETGMGKLTQTLQQLLT